MCAGDPSIGVGLRGQAGLGGERRAGRARHDLPGRRRGRAVHPRLPNTGGQAGAGDQHSGRPGPAAAGRPARAARAGVRRPAHARPPRGTAHRDAAATPVSGQEPALARWPASRHYHRAVRRPEGRPPDRADDRSGPARPVPDRHRAGRAPLPGGNAGRLPQACTHVAEDWKP